MIFLFSRSNKLFKCGIGTMIYNIGFRKDFERMRPQAFEMNANFYTETVLLKLCP